MTPAVRCRHAGNMLVRRPRGSSTSGGGGGLARLAEARLELCPIDHGFCLPEGLEPPYFEWLHWPQVGVRASLFWVRLVAAGHPACEACITGKQYLKQAAVMSAARGIIGHASCVPVSFLSINCSSRHIRPRFTQRTMSHLYLANLPLAANATLTRSTDRIWLS